MSFIHIPDSNDTLLSGCKVETFRSSGKGGQHANKTESAVRLTHINMKKKKKTKIPHIETNQSLLNDIGSVF